MLTRTMFSVALLALSSFALAAPPGTPSEPGVQSVTLDLKTIDGVSAVRGQWRYASATLEPTEFATPAPDNSPTGPLGRTSRITPASSDAATDGPPWQSIDPATLEARRGGGRASFAWYAFDFTVPERLDRFTTSGASVTLELRMDDYAEVWVNGALTYHFGQSGGGVIAGWNALNRVPLAHDVRPGQEIKVAVFAANGPISESPSNYIWVREARLQFTQRPRALQPIVVPAELVRMSPAIDEVLESAPQVEKIAEGFRFTEGPVWIADPGFLLFSDPNSNTIYRWTPDHQLSVFRTPSGYDGADIADYRQPGSNGLTLDSAGRLIINQHGHRRIVRLEPDGTETVIADRYQGRRLNSPNDLAYRLDGTLYFTDPFFGLPMFDQDPRAELSSAGVYMLRDGRVTLFTDELKGPNGIALSPKHTHLYVGNWDDHAKIVKRYALNADGTPSDSGEVFADLTSEPGADAIDGVKVDWAGHVFVCGPGGLWIFSPKGDRLGLLKLPESPHNIAFGGTDARTLFMCCESGLYRVALKTPGILP